MTARPQSYDFRASWKPTSKFREHLSVEIPLDNVPVEKSRFSPESPPPSFRTASASTVTMNNSSRRAADVEAGQTQTPTSARFRERMTNRFTNLFFDLRMLGREPEMVPIEPPHLREWPPLKVEDKQPPRCPCHERHARAKKRRQIWLVALIALLLFLFSDVLFLNVRVVRLSAASSGPVSSPVASATSPSATGLSVDAQQCLSQYTLNAPANPSAYPCSSCLPILQAVPANVSSTDPGDAQQILNAVQFCGLKGIFDSSGATAQTGLHNQGWLNDTRFCAWNGVTCDGTGRVSSLQLTFPAVPTLLPEELGSLTGLQSLSVIGNSAVPSGSLPNSFTNLTSLTTLHLESTALAALPDSLFSTLKKVTALTLIKNAQMGSNLPSSLAQLSLQSLVVNTQPLADPLSAITGSKSLQASLQLLDLSSTNLTASVPPAISSLQALTELHLDSNNVQPPLPPAFPSSLQVLSLQNNSGLSGTLSGCATALKSCDVASTAVQIGTGCSVCSGSS
ncbi:L domain-like protein [Gloeophyllum trabeum ATCC 11539]|uniref:L domain-like protein n=1 Tax=Gloeophyllum trabeum (strain ATCC 11539 / FP-39264 / Madison 617) TaxID=670483 RepID=S7RLK7_GLOTA|nr:L domain-like protein [Gloeophyllum trabeum ATCC 11539]EPQ55290.1 L domain-like protein [Gloeophyllum trabeum ATCC 11539]